MAVRNLPHLFLPYAPERHGFTSTSSGGSKSQIPERDRQSHSAFLQARFRQAREEAENERVVSHVSRTGVYFEFRGFPGVELITKSLEDMRSKQVRLLNVREEVELVYNATTGEQTEQSVTYATVYVANNKIQFFAKKLEDYAEKTRATGNPYHANLINSIADLRKALLIESFWQDTKALMPADEPEWCEVWLSSDNTPATVERFEQILQGLQINAKSGYVRFPERAVKLIYANRSQLELLTRLSDDIAEYRRAKETAVFWMNLSNRDQADWVESLLERIQIVSNSPVSVCLLDTGVNHRHPLLMPLLTENDCHCVDPTWGTHDHDKHGTLMAGIAAYGNLMHTLMNNGSIELRHCLESVKILPLPPNQNAPELWGHVTAQGISRAEIEAPVRKRIICMAVTAADTRDRGRPSSWSATLDQLASGAEDDRRRFIVVSAGNIVDPVLARNYPDAQITDSVHDPAQSWNVLTVGAYTELDTLTDSSLAGYQPIAPKGGLSPFTTTSWTWDDRWPLKPEILLEGGNMAQDGAGFVTERDDLALLSTFYRPLESHFYTFNMTSAATAQAAWLAAQIQAFYPQFWPETIRGLLVHSAEWPATLQQQFRTNESKSAMKKLLRICGYGVPNLERALHSAFNSLTLIAQAELQPFTKDENSSRYRTNDMHLYTLPWPKETLLDLPDLTKVEMRITLSYFIEPGPGEIGWQDRYRYASHALRFDLNSPGESVDDFIKRVNKAARDEDEDHPGTPSASEHWVIGSKIRDKGSIHSDIWRGTAAELASSNLIAITPRIGWWRERAHLGRWKRRTRYALLVSITTPEETVDIYTPVAAQIGVTISIPIG